jgi:hypothetical protein
VKVDTRLPEEAYYEALTDAFVLVATNETPIAASGSMGWLSIEGHQSEHNLVLEMLDDSRMTPKGKFDSHMENANEEAEGECVTPGPETKRPRMTKDVSPDVDNRN